MEEFNPQLVAKRSIRGVFAFISRSFVISGVNFGRDIILAALLSASVYGVYFIVEQLVAMLGYFSDVGLAGALIQKKESVTEEEFQTTFTTQTLLVLIIAIVIFVLAPHIGTFSQLPADGIFLLQAFVVAFFLSSLKTIPSVIMERNLAFGKFVIPQVVETVLYTATVLYFAWKGYGITSFSIAVLVRAIGGVITIYIVCPWKIGFRFSRQALSQLLSFGIPYQANSILALAKDNLIVLLYLPRVLPLYQVGYLAFALKWAFVPLRQVMDNVIRVTFSSFSRLQHDREALGHAFEKSILAGTTLIFPSLVGLVIIAPYAIHIIPKYQKWEPAIVTIILFAINASLASVLVPLTNLLNAIGKIKITLYFMVLWTIITWGLTPIAIHYMSFNGYAFVTAFINISVVPIIFIAKKYVDFHIIRAIKYPFISSVIMGVSLYFISSQLITNIPTLLITIALGGGIYFGVLLVIAKDQLIADLQFIKQNLRR